MYLTLEQFLNYFPSKNISKKKFKKKLKITYKNIISLNDIFNYKKIIKNNEDIRYKNKDKIINFFYDVIITNRIKYLTNFYNAYFKLPTKLNWDNKDIRFVCNDKLLNPSLSVQLNDKGRTIIRNLFHLEILLYTIITNSVKSNVPLWKTLDNMYNKLILEDRLFSPSAISHFIKDKPDGSINYNSLFYFIQQYQPKGSILNPYTIWWLLENIFNSRKKTNRTLFTPVLSWGAYLLAFLNNNNYTYYLGVDVMQSVCDKLILLNQNQNQNQNQKKFETICIQSELLLNDKVFIKKYKNFFNTIIICPPYYTMELYHEGNQSTNIYDNYNEWLEGYCDNTIKLCSILLKRKGIFGMIINNFYSLSKQFYPLIEDLNNISLKYMKPYKYKSDKPNYYYLHNRRSTLRINKKDRTERIIFYTKI